MNINATLFVQMAVFFIGAWVTMKFIWPPLIKALDERQKKIAQLDAEARSRAQALMAETEKRAAAVIDAAKGQAKVEGDRLVAAAKAEAEQEMQRAKDSLRDQVAVLAVAGAEQILKREVNAQVHAELLTQLKARL